MGTSTLKDSKGEGKEWKVLQLSPLPHTNSPPSLLLCRLGAPTAKTRNFSENTKRVSGILEGGGSGLS